MALVGEKINKTHLCSDAKKVCTLQWMLMNIDLCLIFEMKNLISKLGVSLITMSITLKTSFFLLNRRSKKNASWSNKNASRYLYKINVIGLAENKILMNIAFLIIWGKNFTTFTIKNAAQLSSSIQDGQTCTISRAHGFCIRPFFGVLIILVAQGHSRFPYIWTRAWRWRWCKGCRWYRCCCWHCCCRYCWTYCCCSCCC